MPFFGVNSKKNEICGETYRKNTCSKKKTGRFAPALALNEGEKGYSAKSSLALPLYKRYMNII